MNKLLHNRPLVISLGVLFLIFCGLVIAWASALYTLKQMSFMEVTPTQLASAMRKDEFWSSYRFNTLIFEGKVQSSGTNHDKTTVGFVTGDAYGASCELSSPTSTFKIGQTYKFEAETYQAERQPGGVLLHNCINL